MSLVILALAEGDEPPPYGWALVQPLSWLMGMLAKGLAVTVEIVGRHGSRPLHFKTSPRYGGGEVQPKAGSAKRE